MVTTDNDIPKNCGNIFMKMDEMETKKTFSRCPD
jgi:hypothetical protein